MYGMVNKAVMEMVLAGHGEEAWERIRSRAGVEEEVFIGTEPYDDAITYRLVGAASEELGLPPEKILEAFGAYWVLHTARENYGPLMEAGGRTLPEFLQNLPRFHDRIALMFPKLRPPIFRVGQQGEKHIVLEYRSHREGLQPFVAGLLRGLGEFYGVPVSVELSSARHGGQDHDAFTVRWSGGG